MTTPFTALSWYKVSPDLAAHPKIMELADELGVDEFSALGRWHSILSFAARYAPNDGNLSKYPSKRIAREAGMDDGDFLLKALVKVRLCDETTYVGTQSDSKGESHYGIRVIIHNWTNWHGDVTESRGAASAKSDGGKLGSHRRWHGTSGKPSRDCDYCMGVLSEPTSDSYMHRVEKSKGEERKDGSPSPSETRPEDEDLDDDV